MIKNLKNKFKENFEIFALIILIFIASIFTTYFDYKKKLENQTYTNFIDNIYFKKTLKYIVQNLDPKYKKIQHKVKKLSQKKTNQTNLLMKLLMRFLAI